MEGDERENINILLVDDDEDEYIIARDLFSEIGDKYKIHWESDFYKALDEAVKSEYDICLLDYHMGAHNGIDFINQAVLRNCELPIILLTGQGDHKIDIGAMKAGATDYLDKNTLDINTLERSVRYALERKKSAEKIRFLAFYDQLTKLPNRSLFFDRVNTTVAAAKRYNRIFAIMFLDIDNFKRINDTLGHNIGDMLIKEVALRLLNSIRRDDIVVRSRFVSVSDTVARLGGDEFTILLSEIKEPENASKVAERIRNELISPVVLEDKKINVTVSIGISIYPDDGYDAETLIKNADIAMYNSKYTGKDSFQYYSKSMNTTASQRLTLESELGRALEKNELVVFYQPMIELKTRKIYGLEALVRWQHPGEGIILPMKFIPVAEEIGLINKLGSFVLNTAGEQFNKWNKDGLAEFNISINISPKQLNQKSFLNDVKDFIDKHKISPQNIIFEITENSIIHNIEETNKIIQSIRGMGIKIALDDFGGGYFSFNILRKAFFDILKIDCSFMINVPANKEDSAIVASLLSIGHNMNLKVLAEGIEKEEQLQFLELNDCDLFQGFYFSRPLPENEIREIIKR